MQAEQLGNAVQSLKKDFRNYRYGDYLSIQFHMRDLATKKSRVLVVIALICAMASTGFAHRFISQPLDPSLTAYVAAGGSLADICGQTGGSSHHTLQSCEACQLVNAAVLPAHEPACAAPLAPLSAVLVPNADLILRHATLDLSRAARAPPAV